MGSPGGLKEGLGTRAKITGGHEGGNPDWLGLLRDLSVQGEGK